MSGQPDQDTTETMEIDAPPTTCAPEPEVTELLADRRSLVKLSSNTVTESCGAYISRTVELLASVEPVTTVPNDEIPAEIKASISDPVAITPGLNELIPEEKMPESVPRVVFLDKPDTQITPSQATVRDQNILENAVATEQPTLMPDSATQPEHTEERRTEAFVLNEQRVDRGPMYYRSHTDDDSCFGMKNGTGSLARSTLAQAL